MSPTDDCGPDVSTATANSASVFITVHVLYLYIVFFSIFRLWVLGLQDDVAVYTGTCSK